MAPTQVSPSMFQTFPPREAVAEALTLLGKDDLVLAIHDASFPSAPGEDTGRGTPYAAGGLAFLDFLRALGFNGVQLGPQGQTSRQNASPYDGTLLSRNVLTIPAFDLARREAWGGLVPAARVEEVVSGNPQPDGARVAYLYAYDRQMALLDEAWRTFGARREAGDARVLDLDASLRAFFGRGRAWLERDALYEVVGHRPYEAVDARLRTLHAAHLERFAFLQLLVHGSHEALRAHARSLGLALYGDLQIGMSPRDVWALGDVVLSDWRMGAPPSRTNPEGQPWGYAVLDPDRYLDEAGAPGPALAFFRTRLEKIFSEYDGVRIDHPHGLVCPWVYRADDPDRVHAVRDGARLFCSPELAGHPRLSRFAIPRPEQIEPSLPRYADGWVRALDPAQEDRYAVLFDTLVDVARAHGRGVESLVCEVLSTQPHPLARVMARHGLGRFRVTQKANPADPNDVYRSENAEPADWIMVGNHDTPPVWRLADDWHGTEAGATQAALLARRLKGDGDAAAFARTLEADPRRLVHAKMADLFASRARHVMIFFPDLLGMRDVYNRPGTVSEENWSLRVPPDYVSLYESRARRGEALDLGYVLALALRARGADFARAHAGLIARLEARAGAWAREDEGILAAS